MHEPTRSSAPSRALPIVAALLLTACAGSFGAPTGPAPVGSSAETEAALSVLEIMSGQLASLEGFRFDAEVRYDAIQPSGQRIEFGSTRRVSVRRPDALRVEVEHWDGPSEWVVYDGARIWVASPSLHAYASAEQSGSYEDALDRLERDVGVPMPLAELLAPELHRELADLVVSGARVGTVVLEGRLCEHLAFRTASLDFQLFVERGEHRIPRRLVIDYREEPGRPQFRASLHAWELNPGFAPDTFRLVAPAGAERIPLEELLERLTPARAASEDPVSGAGPS